MKKKKLFIVSAFSGPLDGVLNNRFIYLANYLSGRYQVELITTNFYHSKKRYINKPYHFNNFKLTLLKVPKYSENISVLRLWSHLILSLKVYKYLKRKAFPDDIVYCSFPPIFLSYLAFKAVKNKEKFILDIQDLWPEVFYASSKLKWLKCFFGVHRLVVRALSKKLYNLVAVSETYMNHFKIIGFNGENEAVVHLGVDDQSLKELNNRLDSQTKSDAVKFVYAGTLGHSYNLDHFIRCFSQAEKKLRSQVKLKLMIMGSGPLENKLKQLSNNLKVNVEFTGRLPYKQVLKELTNSDIAVNSVAKGMQQSIINKHGDYLVMGLPILSTQDNTEFKKLVDDYYIGLNVDPLDEEALIDSIVYLSINKSVRIEMAENAKALGQLRFNRLNSYKKIQSLLDEL